MSIDATNELVSFHRFVSEQLQAGTIAASPEEVLDLWRSQCPPAGEPAETVAALREALQDMAGGDHGAQLTDFDREFRR